MESIIVKITGRCAGERNLKSAVNRATGVGHRRTPGIGRRAADEVVGYIQVVIERTARLKSVDRTRGGTCGSLIKTITGDIPVGVAAGKKHTYVRTSSVEKVKDIAIRDRIVVVVLRERGRGGGRIHTVNGRCRAVTNIAVLNQVVIVAVGAGGRTE